MSFITRQGYKLHCAPDEIFKFETFMQIKLQISHNFNFL